MDQKTLELINILFNSKFQEDENERERAWDDIANDLTQQEVIEHVASILENLEYVEKNYGVEPMDSGLWFIFGEPLEICLEIGILERTGQDIKVGPARKRLFQSFEAVYSPYLVNNPPQMLETSYQMLWDIVLTSLWFNASYRQSDIDEFNYQNLPAIEKELIDISFEILKRLLETNEWRVWYCAMHGMGHLHHPEVAATIDRFIARIGDEAQDFEPEWIEQCKNGTCM